MRSARPSPRIENGVVCWYGGDKFEIGFDLTITDVDDEPVALGEDDVVIVEVNNSRGVNIKTFTFDNVENNYITLVFDEEATELFPKGSYFYDIKLDNGQRTTIINNNRIIVR